MPTSPGRALVAAYYRHSPPLADAIEDSALLRGAARTLLTPLVLAVSYPRGTLAALLALWLAIRLRRRQVLRRHQGCR
jgi:hypothetical protein